MTMTAQETADSLAEMTGAFARRRDAILAALLAERKAALAEAAAWHRKEIVELEIGCEASWPEYTPELGLHALKVHRESLTAILSLSPEGKGPTDHTPEEET